VTNAPIDKEQPQGTLAGTVYQAIRRDILTCKLLPGQPLRSDMMKLEYGASISTIREAIARLASEGLVQQLDQRGARVATISEADLRDLLKVRENLESIALRWSIKNGGEQWEAAAIGRFHIFRRSLQRRNPSISYDLDLQAAHEDFHLSLVSACDSPRLLSILRSLYTQSRRYRFMADYGRASDSDVIEEHESIMDAAFERDADRACRLFEEHAAKTVDLALANLAVLQRQLEERAELERQ
jgi:GntR family transcriptional regulator, carbon starvation induced regulator